MHKPAIGSPRRSDSVLARAFQALVGFAISLNASQATAQSYAPFDQFRPPDAWEAAYWASGDAAHLLELDPRALAALVPVQAGFKHCRCPACGALERENPLTWSVEKPDSLVCRLCKAEFPNDKIPAKTDGKVPEDVVEVRPAVFHHYPYHVIAPEKQIYPDERVYLAAKRDEEAKAFLAKFALYAAIRHNDRKPPRKDPALARAAAVIVLRFAQVYPAYAMHFDQPEKPKLIDKADLEPPYRPGWQTGKWEDSAALEVPLNLLIAYALLRDDEAIDFAGRLLNDRAPRTTIERDFFGAAAELCRRQPDRCTEESLFAYRGMLAVAVLRNDQALKGEVSARLERFQELGFYHDGLWRRRDTGSQARVLSLMEGWISRLMAAPGKAPKPAETPALVLARRAEAGLLLGAKLTEVERAAWPTSPFRPAPREPMLLGGSGFARLAAGSGAGALDLELKGFGGPNETSSSRLSLRLAAGGRPLLDDHDDTPPTPDGWGLSSAAHNTVIVDGLNQRETFPLMQAGAPGADILFFAISPRLQVASFEDPRAYPRSTSRYRHTVALVSSSAASYAISVFEVHGGLQHEQIFHFAESQAAGWSSSIEMGPRSESLLPASVKYLEGAAAAQGRWFVQAMGAFTDLREGRQAAPNAFTILRRDGSGLRLHLLESVPMRAITAHGPREPGGDGPGRPALILRRRSSDGGSLNTTFVTVFEPIAPAIPRLERVGVHFVKQDAVCLYVETSEGVEEIVVNFKPGEMLEAPLSNGALLRTDGLLAGISRLGLSLAGGTFAETAELRVAQPRETGRVLAAVRERSALGAGWFRVTGPLSDPASLKNRTLIIRHGDSLSRGWTITEAENLDNRTSKIYVLEEPGFAISNQGKRTEQAVYCQFPRDRFDGPSTFGIPLISEVGPASAGRSVERERGRIGSRSRPSRK